LVLSSCLAATSDNHAASLERTTAAAKKRLGSSIPGDPKFFVRRDRFFNRSAETDGACSRLQLTRFANVWLLQFFASAITI
jgi:hypothetical protein